MPAFLERKLRAEYGDNPRAVYGTFKTNLGALRGNKITPKGRAMQARHDRDVAAGRTGGGRHPRGRLAALMGNT